MRGRPGDLGRGAIRVNVVYLPVHRGEIIPSLLEGRGDLAAANLTVTPERLAKVDFGRPWSRDVREIVVTGPASPPLEAMIPDSSSLQLRQAERSMPDMRKSEGQGEGPTGEERRRWERNGQCD